MSVWYKSASFWTMLVAAAVQIGVGIGYQLEVEMMGALAATVIAYLVQLGIVTKAEVQAEGDLIAQLESQEYSERMEAIRAERWERESPIVSGKK